MTFVLGIFVAGVSLTSPKKLIELFHNNHFISYFGFIDNQAVREIVFLDFGFTNYVCIFWEFFFLMTFL